MLLNYSDYDKLTISSVGAGYLQIMEMVTRKTGLTIMLSLLTVTALSSFVKAEVLIIFCEEIIK